MEHQSIMLSLTWFVLGLALSIASENTERPPTSDDEITNCATKCRAEDYAAYGNASLTCRHMGEEENPKVMPPCYHGCLHPTIPDDASQKQCFCKLCKEVYGFGFCREGESHINPDDCDNLVCSGDHPDVKFRGHVCQQNKNK